MKTLLTTLMLLCSVISYGQTADIDYSDNDINIYISDGTHYQLRQVDEVRILPDNEFRITSGDVTLFETPSRLTIYKGTLLIASVPLGVVCFED